MNVTSFGQGPLRKFNKAYLSTVFYYSDVTTPRVLPAGTVMELNNFNSCLRTMIVSALLTMYVNYH